MNKTAKILITVFVFFLIALSCGKEEERYRVTWLRVDFTINLNSLDTELRNYPGVKIFTKSQVINRGEYMESPGVIVHNNAGIFEDVNGHPLMAYDLRCPNENSTSVLITLDGTQAVCPSCETKYDLTFGNAVSGPSRTRLQDYRISSRGGGQYRIYSK